MRSTEKAMPILLIFFFGASGIWASLALAELLGEEPKPQHDFTTRFYVINESEMISGKPAFYRTIIENQEGTTVDYDLKVRSAGEVVYNQKIRLNISDSLNQTIFFILNQTGDYQKLEFLLYKDNAPYRTRIFQVSRASDYGHKPDLISISPQNADTGKNAGIEFIENYSKQKRDDIIVYAFNTGEKLELMVSNDTAGEGDAVYTTASKGNNIIFLGETYEKLLPGTTKYINPVIMNASEIALKDNDTLNLKNGYAVTFNYIDEQNLKFIVSKNKRILREIISPENSPVEYWQEIDDDYKKQKIISIIPKKIDQNGIVFDLIQFGGNKMVMVGNRYGEFQITNITEDSIILKNTQEIKIRKGQEISLINGKIKIKV